MPCQPGCRCRGFPIRQNVDDASPFQIADDRAVAVTPLPGKIIDADHPRFLEWLDSTTPHDPQQGVVAHGQKQEWGPAPAPIHMWFYGTGLRAVADLANLPPPQRNA